MTPTAILLLVLVVTLVASMAIAVVIVRGSRTRADASLAVLGPPLRSMAASALGRTDDAEPLTGTGTLVLTADEVGFAQWRPARLLRIRRADLIRTDTTREHLGKTMNHDVLRLTWRGTAGVEESVAFFVRDLEPWLEDLGGHRSTDD